MSTVARYDLYLKRLGLNTIFELNPNYPGHAMYTTQHPVAIDTWAYLNLEYTPGGGMNIYVRYMNGWSTIDFGAYMERGVKILEYLVGNGFKQAEPLLREHKINHLLTSQ